MNEHRGKKQARKKDRWKSVRMSRRKKMKSRVNEKKRKKEKARAREHAGGSTFPRRVVHTELH